jgi:hypothetical protein
MKQEAFFKFKCEFTAYLNSMKTVDSYILWYSRDRIKKMLNWMGQAEYWRAYFQPSELRP